MREAIRRGIPVVSYPEAVAELFNVGKGIAVAGSHGKSTTSALLGVTLEKLGCDPTVITGAVVKNWDSNARISKNPKSKTQISNKNSKFQILSSKLFVLEADEYRNAFLHYRPFAAIITSVDWDHSDFFPTPSSYRAAFAKFASGVDSKGFLIVNGDDSATRALARKTSARRTITYGVEPRNTLQISNIAQKHNGLAFSAKFRKKSLGRFRVYLFGRHHAMNAAAVVAACLALGEKPDRIRHALGSFRGTVRRFEILNPKFGIRSNTQNSKFRVQNSPIIVDDYAHHPTEIRATITAARETFPGRRVRVLFQPHTFSRTRTFFRKFVAALGEADDVGLLKTYGSAREKGGAERSRSEDIARALGVRHFTTHHAAIAHYRRTLRPNDIFLALGAGDGDQLAKKLVKSEFFK